MERIEVAQARESPEQATGWPWILVAVTMAAFALRLAMIDEQSLRGDEALSALYAQKTLPEIIEITRFVSGHPPLFYSLLHFWTPVAGSRVLAVRFVAAWWGVLCVPLSYAVGKRLFGVRAGLWTALLLAISPFQIMHSQDARAYSMLAALALAASWMLDEAMRRTSRWKWVCYALLATLLAYTHYFGAFVIAAHGAFFGWDRWRRRGAWLSGILGFAFVGLALLPWLWLARTVVGGGHGAGGRALSLAGMVQQCLLTFGIGYWYESWGAVALPVALAALLLWGVWSGWREHPRGLWLTALCGALPLLAVYALSLRRPVFRERYLIATAPFYALLWGRGLARLPRRAFLLATLCGVIGFNLLALSHYYWDPAYAKSPEWRAAAAFVRDHMQAQDIVVLNHQDQAFLYHLGATDVQVLPAGDNPSAEATRLSLQDLANAAERVWLVPDTALAWDKEGVVSGWLEQECEEVAVYRWRGVDVVLYHTPRLYAQEMVALDARLGADIRLLGYVMRDPSGVAVERLTVRPGQTVRLSLYWQAQASIDRDLVVFAHLLDATGWLRGQQDNQPRSGTFPTRAWSPADVVVDVYRIPLDPSTPAGEMGLEVGMYDPIDGTRLPASGLDADPEQRRVLIDGVQYLP